MTSNKKTSAFKDVQQQSKSTKILYQESCLAQERLNTLLKFLPDPVFVFTFNNTVEYINPAFEKIFGWTLKEVQGKNINFIPANMEAQAKQGMKMLYKNKSVHDFETQRYTKDGRILDILINGSILYDENNKPAGQVLILRDMTIEKRMAKSNKIMFRISKALHHYHTLGDLIALINKEIQELISVEGAFILLADNNKDQLYFFSAQYRDLESEKKFKKIRIPSEKGVSGRVYKTGKPIIVPDVSKCSFYYQKVDDETDLVARNVLSVPIKHKDKSIGVVTVVNKTHGEFDSTDIELLSMVTSSIALPIENTRIHEELQLSYEDLKILNRAKDKVINHLSHEIKTPVSVLSASMKLLSKKIKNTGLENDSIEKILIRATRNLNRILDIQYEVEDLLKKKDFKAYNLLKKLLDACKDELLTLVENETDDIDIVNKINKSIESLFGPKDIRSKPIMLDKYLKQRIKELEPEFQHRKCSLNIQIDHANTIDTPVEILDIITKGIIKNAFEYTPDGSKIEIYLKSNMDYPELIIKDYGIGFTKERLHLIFENFFNPPDSVNYSTKKPYDFNAGGRGFDLLRMKVFSEKYNFKIWIESNRCGLIPGDSDVCPGDISLCEACVEKDYCLKSGGTSVHIKFK
jgi:PAS domain S-box-containing protein